MTINPELADGPEAAQDKRREKAVSRWENEGGGLTHLQGAAHVQARDGAAGHPIEVPDALHTLEALEDSVVVLTAVNRVT